MVEPVTLFRGHPSGSGIAQPWTENGPPWSSSVSEYRALPASDFDALVARAEKAEAERDRLVEALAAAAIEHDGCDVGGWSICRVDPENDEAEGLEWLALPPGAGSGVAYADAHDAIRAALHGKAAGDA